MPDQEFGGGWTEQKLQILDNYLAAYCKIFQANPRARHLDTIYVDAFAGSGLIQQSANREVEEQLFSEFIKPDAIEFLKGSATRALQHRCEPPAEWQQALDRIFGTHDWYSRFYKTEKEVDLFKEEVTSTHRVADSNAVAAFMIERLERAFHAVAKKPGILYNSQNVPLYLFCFASANPKGAPTALKIAKDLLKRLN